MTSGDEAAAESLTPEAGPAGQLDVSAAQAAAARRRAAERRRLAEVFGEVLPESSRDDIDEPASGGRAARGEDATDDRDADLLRDVPPHHIS
jgi:hypothetical protein